MHEFFFNISYQINSNGDDSSMSHKHYYFYVKVRLPWGTVTHYQLSHDLDFALRQFQHANHGNYTKPLKYAILNVPIMELSWQHHYHKFVVPALVIETFINNQPCHWRTRGQFISFDHFDPTDQHQIQYLKHDYSKMNQTIIEHTLHYWTHYLLKKGLKPYATRNNVTP